FVDHIVYSFEDPLFSDWYQSQQELLLVLSFMDFMIKVCLHWLPKCWQQELARKVRSTKQSETPFSDFIDSMCQDNLLLKNSQFHLSPTQLHTQIKSNISPELAAAFDQWKDNYESSDDETDENIDTVIELLTNEAERSLKWSSSTVRLADGTRRAPFSCAQAANTSRNAMLSSTAHPPKTDCKQKYLEAYNGCKKCGGFYMLDGHTCNFPSGDGYMERSMPTVNEACKWIKLPAFPIPRAEQGTTVGAVSLSNNVYNTMLPQPNTIPPALPIMSDSDLSHDSNDLVSMHIPFFKPHLLWECTVDMDASTLSHVEVSALIDHGSPAVLIKEEVISHLCMTTCLLPHPFPISGAFFDKSSSSSDVSLTHWVKLKLHDQRNLYSTCTVCALVAPKLCHPMILGLPFLSHNHIVVD
ncbi:hypothetical protein L208DRAFT_1128180, partial [Tricholoma matsutake]